MNKFLVLGLALLVSGCSGHGLRQLFVPEPVPVASYVRMQFNCNASGLFIFEDFPAIEQAHPVMDNTYSLADQFSNPTRNSADSPEDCPILLN